MGLGDHREEVLASPSIKGIFGVLDPEPPDGGCEPRRLQPVSSGSSSLGAGAVPTLGLEVLVGVPHYPVGLPGECSPGGAGESGSSHGSRAGRPREKVVVVGCPGLGSMLLLTACKASPARGSVWWLPKHLRGRGDGETEAQVLSARC